MPLKVERRGGRWLAVVFTLLLSNAALHAQAPPSVQTKAGTVVGRQHGSVRTFAGIPYAAPPVGDLRWNAPRPPSAWTAPRDASRFGDVCVQVVSGMLEGDEQRKGKIIGNENCLYLNVYAPDGATLRTRLPTMVWLHGGAFIFGAGSSYDASVLPRNTALWS